MPDIVSAECRGSIANSKVLQMIMRVKSLTKIGMPVDVVKKALAILNGQDSVEEGFPVPKPWSEEAKTQASQYTWQVFFSKMKIYEDGTIQTPFEQIFEDFSVQVSFLGNRSIYWEAGFTLSKFSVGYTLLCIISQSINPGVANAI